MRAAVLTGYGAPEQLQVREVERPTPGPRDVLVRVHATTVTVGDTELRTSNLPWLFWIPLRLAMGLFRPKRQTIPGMELAGIVESVGAQVEGFAPGDAVYGASDFRFGANAEYACLPSDGLIAAKPAGLSFEQAATLPIGGLAALGYLHKGGVGRGKTVLVRGASGSIGTYAVGLAKHFGARVTGVCGPRGVDRVRALGADVVLDHTRRDFTEDGSSYDLILDVVGRMPISRCLRFVKPGGRYVRGTIPGLWEVVVALWSGLTRRKRVVLGDAGGTAQDLARLGELLAAGTIEAVIDRRYPLEEIVEAHRYVETGHKQGHVVIVVAESG